MAFPNAAHVKIGDFYYRVNEADQGGTMKAWTRPLYAERVITGTDGENLKPEQLIWAITDFTGEGQYTLKHGDPDLGTRFQSSALFDFTVPGEMSTPSTITDWVPGNDSLQTHLTQTFADLGPRPVDMVTQQRRINLEATEGAYNLSVDVVTYAETDDAHGTELQRTTITSRGVIDFYRTSAGSPDLSWQGVATPNGGVFFINEYDDFATISVTPTYTCRIYLADTSVDTGLQVTEIAELPGGVAGHAIAYGMGLVWVMSANELFVVDGTSIESVGIIRPWTSVYGGTPASNPADVHVQGRDVWFLTRDTTNSQWHLGRYDMKRGGYFMESEQAGTYQVERDVSVAETPYFRTSYYDFGLPFADKTLTKVGLSLGSQLDASNQEIQKVTLTGFDGGTADSFKISYGGNDSVLIGNGGETYTDAHLKSAIEGITGFTGTVAITGRTNSNFWVTFSPVNTAFTALSITNTTGCSGTVATTVDGGTTKVTLSVVYGMEDGTSTTYTVSPVAEYGVSGYDKGYIEWDLPTGTSSIICRYAGLLLAVTPVHFDFPPTTNITGLWLKAVASGEGATDKFFDAELLCWDEDSGFHIDGQNVAGGAMMKNLEDLRDTGEIVTFIDGYRSEVIGDNDTYSVVITDVNRQHNKQGEAVVLCRMRVV